MHVAIVGHYGGINLGDDAILASIVDMLQKLGGAGIQITPFSHNPDVSYAQTGVTAAKQISLPVPSPNDLVKLFRIIRASDCLIIGGGGLLQDEFNLKTIPRFLLPALIGKLFNKRVVFFALGVGPLSMKYSKTLIALIGKQVDTISVRDDESFKQLEHIGIKDAIVTSDPAFAVPRCDQERASSLLRKQGVGKEETLIGVSLRNFYHTGDSRNPINRNISWAFIQRAA